jgi:hypothetical protein
MGWRTAAGPIADSTTGGSVITALCIAIYLLVGVAHATLMGESRGRRGLITATWPLLYLIMAYILLGQGFNAVIDRLQGAHFDESD